MTTFLLERFSNHSKMGVFGTLVTPSGLYNTVEQAWNNNRPFQSCIPAGIYTFKEFHSQKYGKTFAITGGTVAETEAQVRQNPDLKRWACLLHAANKASQLQGCIAPGMALGAIDGEWAVINSAAAMREILKEITDGDRLIIHWKNNDDN